MRPCECVCLVVCVFVAVCFVLQCPEVDRVLECAPARCQICGYQRTNMEQLFRCPACKLFGCSWCQLSDLGTRYVCVCVCP